MAASRCFSGDINCRSRKSAGPEGHEADAQAKFLRRLFEARTAEALEAESAWHCFVPQIRDGLWRLPVLALRSGAPRAETGFQGLLIRAHFKRPPTALSMRAHDLLGCIKKEGG